VRTGGGRVPATAKRLDGSRGRRMKGMQRDVEVSGGGEVVQDVFV
jgi:hypothetical protein